MCVCVCVCVCVSAHCFKSAWVLAHVCLFRRRGVPLHQASNLVQRLRSAQEATQQQKKSSIASEFASQVRDAQTRRDGKADVHAGRDAEGQSD